LILLQNLVEGKIRGKVGREKGWKVSREPSPRHHPDTEVTPSVKAGRLLFVLRGKTLREGVIFL
jgi:hypothetical protein